MIYTLLYCACNLATQTVDLVAGLKIHELEVVQEDGYHDCTSAQLTTINSTFGS